MTGVSDRLAAAARLVELGAGRIPDEAVTDLAEVTEIARGRLGVAGDTTVVAIAGPTGMGKSSLTNALLDVELARVGVTRPTTAEPLAVAVGSEPGSDLLAHLSLQRWEQLPADGREGLDGLLLVDLPDHDSVVAAHRERAAQLVATADRLLWVVDPEKYADASVHDDLLVPLRAHAGVLTVVLNRIDRVAPDERPALLAHLRDLLRSRGMGSVEVLGSSTVDGTGIAELRALLARTVADHRSTAARIEADLRGLSADLDDHVPLLARTGRRGAPEPIDPEPLVDAAAHAAGVPGVLDAVAATHRHRAARATGWPLVRRFTARGRDPLTRLGLGRGREKGPTGSRSSRALPQGVATATLHTATRHAADAVAAGWPAPWRDPLDDRLDVVVDGLPAALDRAVSRADLDDDRTPLWWRVVGALQWSVLLAALVGLVWRAVGYGVVWLGLPALPSTPVAGSLVEWSTALVVGGLLAGILLALLTAPLRRVGARRARNRVGRRLRVAVTEVVEAEVLGALEDARAEADEARTALALLRAR